MTMTDVYRELIRKQLENGRRAERLGPTTEGKVAAHVESAYRDAAELVGAAIQDKIDRVLDSTSPAVKDSPHTTASATGSAREEAR
jgi:hypothetical protein